jgi:DNA-binding MltR family transcriptional regulator
MVLFRTVGDIWHDQTIVEEIDRQEDRGAAIIAGAFLEDFIGETIKARFVRDEVAVKKLFGGFGPLATFSAKIEVAYLMGLISKHSRTLANSIRNIRNDFAHNMGSLTFETPLIKGKCQGLLRQRDIKTMHRAAAKLFKKHGNMMGVIESTFPELLEMADTARNAYINTVKVHALLLQKGWGLAANNEVIFPRCLIDQIPD